MAWADLNIVGPRVRLRPVRDGDVAAIKPWYGEAAAALHGASDARAHALDGLLHQIEAARLHPHGGLLAITRSGQDGPIGLLDYRIDTPGQGCATIGSVALAAGARRWSLGQDAVRLFEQEAQRRWGVRAFRAGVDVRHGLALYFWLRLGYRPLDAATDPAGHHVLTMGREVLAPAPSRS